MASYEGINPDYNDPNQAAGSDNGFKQDVKDVEKIAALTQKIAKGNKRIRNLRIFERVMNLIASMIITALMVYTLETYLVTRGEKVNGMGPFGSNPKVWPTYVMTAVAGITLLFNLCVLFAYCCGHKTADKVASQSTYIKLLSPIGHLIIWGSSAGSFQAAADGKNNDLWSFSCSEDPSIVSIQENFEKRINYDRLCTLNTIGLYTAFGTAAFAIINVIIWVIVTIYQKRHDSREKELEAAQRFENYRNSPTSYAPQKPHFTPSSNAF